MSQQGLWTVTLMWLLWLGIGVQCLLALRAVMVERREGMRLSTRRSLALAGIFLLATLVVLFLSIAGQPQPAQAPTPASLPQSLSQPQRDQAAKIQNDIAQNEKALQDLQERARKLNDQQTEIRKQQNEDRTNLTQLGIHQPVLANIRQSMQEFDPRGRADLGLALLTALLVGSIVMLTLGGQFQTLLPAGLSAAFGIQPYEPALKQDLDRLATLVQSGKYHEAAEHAHHIPEKRLRPLDQLDFLYLRSIAFIQLVAFPEKEDSGAEQRSRIETAVSDLQYITEQAPKRDEALYALGIAHGLGEARNYAKALMLSTAPSLSSPPR